MDIFDEKSINPMLIKDQVAAFDSEDFIYEIKLDGIRCMAYLDSTGTDLRNKRDKKILQHVPELSCIYQQVNDKCILDGELFVLKNGITDFYEIQRRILMLDPFKIKLAADRYPASFVAYDIIYYKDKLVNDLPLMERKELLEKVINENNLISISRYIETNGIHLFELAKQNGLEGIVAKRKDSKYYFGKRTRDWLKCKVMDTIDCVICGYIKRGDNIAILILGQYDGESLIYKGHVSLGVGQRVFNHQKYNVVNNCPFGYVPKGNEDAVWLEPDLVCIVESMPSEKDNFRQPVFKGIRNDKTPLECNLIKGNNMESF